MLFAWIRQRREAKRLAQEDAERLLSAKGERALAEACRRERVRLVSGGPPKNRRDAGHWRRVAEIIAKRTEGERTPQIGVGGLVLSLRSATQSGLG